MVILGGAAYGNYTLKYTSLVNQYQINVSFAATQVAGGYQFNQGPYGFERPFFQESPIGGYYISCLLVDNGENLYSGLNFCMANSTFGNNGQPARGQEVQDPKTIKEKYDAAVKAGNGDLALILQTQMQQSAQQPVAAK